MVAALLKTIQPAPQNPKYVEMHSLHWKTLEGFKTRQKAKNAPRSKRSPTFSGCSEGSKTPEFAYVVTFDEEGGLNELLSWYSDTSRRRFDLCE